MRLRVLGDFHFEKLYSNGLNVNQLIEEIDRKIPHNDENEILIAPGDLGIALDKDGELLPEYDQILKYLRKRWKYVVYIPGDAEYHGIQKYDSLILTEKALKEKCEELGIHYLQKGVIKIDDYYVVGCTLWKLASHEEWKAWDEENRKIFMNLNSLHAEYLDHMEWLSDILDEMCKLNEKAIVITHFPPTCEYKKCSKYMENFFEKHKDCVKTWLYYKLEDSDKELLENKNIKFHMYYSYGSDDTLHL